MSTDLAAFVRGLPEAQLHHRRTRRELVPRLVAGSGTPGRFLREIDDYVAAYRPIGSEIA
ncbi:hypothetical protein ACQP2U_06755 [Nocardia sp. CA-084685]|uniref:hypothetical protein n=1 Tax=Nocardia sp. CA-084685 TaxID=3239970 RepID=UPI003D97FE2C